MSYRDGRPLSWLARIMPGLRRETTASGAPIDFSANGTTSVSSGFLSGIARRRFDEMKDADERTESAVA